MNDAISPTSHAVAGIGCRPGISDEAVLVLLRRRLMRLAIKMLWNRDDAEEIVQEAFTLAMAKGLKTTDGHFDPWLTRTVGNLCLNERRRYRPEPLGPWIDPPHGATPAEAAEKKERLRRMRDSIALLPPQQRLALVLKTMEQREYAEIAEIMQLSISAVRVHVHLGRRRLAELLTVQKGERL